MRDDLYGSLLFSALQKAAQRRIIGSQYPCLIAIKRVYVHLTFLRTKC